MAPHVKNQWRRKRPSLYRLRRSRADEWAFVLALLFATSIWALLPGDLFRPPHAPEPRPRTAPAAYVEVDFSHSPARPTGGFIALADTSLPSFPQHIELRPPPLSSPGPFEIPLPRPPAPVAPAPVSVYLPPLPRPEPEAPPAIPSLPPRFHLSLSPELAAAGYSLPTNVFIALPANHSLPLVEVSASVAMDANGRPACVLVDSAAPADALPRWRSLLLAARSTTNATGRVTLEYR